MSKKVKETSILTQRSKPEKIVFGIIFALFLIYAVSLIFPFVWMAVLSLEEAKSLNTAMKLNGAFYIPEVLYFSNYIDAFTTMEDNGVNFIGMLMNSAWFVGIGLLFTMFWHSITAYIFAKYKFKGRNFIYTCAIFSMIVPIIGSSGAMYRLMAELNLYDSGPLYLMVTSCGGFGGTFLMMYGMLTGTASTGVSIIFLRSRSAAGLLRRAVCCGGRSAALCARPVIRE